MIAIITPKSQNMIAKITLKSLNMIAIITPNSPNMIAKITSKSLV
jgi:hypothetical protein